MNKRLKEINNGIYNDVCVYLVSVYTLSVCCTFTVFIVKMPYV